MGGEGTVSSCDTVLVYIVYNRTCADVIANISESEVFQDKFKFSIKSK